jgi:hypothetical protein
MESIQTFYFLKLLCALCLFPTKIVALDLKNQSFLKKGVINGGNQTNLFFLENRQSNFTEHTFLNPKRKKRL